MSNRTTVSDGDLLSPSTWDGGTLPASGDTATLYHAHTLSGSLPALAHLYVADGGSLAIQGDADIPCDIVTTNHLAPAIVLGVAATLTVGGHVYGGAGTYHGQTAIWITNAAAVLILNGNAYGGSGTNGLTGGDASFTYDGDNNINGATAGQAGDPGLGGGPAVAANVNCTIIVTGSIVTGTTGQPGADGNGIDDGNGHSAAGGAGGAGGSGSFGILRNGQSMAASGNISGARIIIGTDTLPQAGDVRDGTYFGPGNLTRGTLSQTLSPSSDDIQAACAAAIVAAGLATAAELAARTLPAVEYATAGLQQSLSAGERNALADAVLARSVAGVEATADQHSLCYVVLALSEADRTTHEGCLTVYRSDGTTEFCRKALTTTTSAVPTVTKIV